jgi:hypothetical protein
MTSRSTLTIERRYAVGTGGSFRPGQVQQDHDPLGLQDPVGQQPSSGTKAHRPAGIAKAAPAKDHAGLGGIHPKDRDHAGDRAGQPGRCLAELLVDPPGDQDLVGGFSPSRGLLPGHHLGPITLADPLGQGLPFGKLLGRGVGGSLGIGIASLMRPA